MRKTFTLITMPVVPVMCEVECTIGLFVDLLPPLPNFIYESFTRELPPVMYKKEKNVHVSHLEACR